MIELGHSLLAIDVGAGTQDILVYDPEKEIENCAQLIIPSGTKIVEGMIRDATLKEKDIFLTGNLMGGGPCVRAIKEHIERGFRVSATELAAKTVKDDLERVKSMGIEIVDCKPAGAVEIETRDVDLPALKSALECFGIEMPEKYAVAVQDHGESPPGESNRKFRFKFWKRFIQSGGEMKSLGYFDPPPFMTRMRAVQRDLPGSMVADTGSAAILGAMCDPEVKARSENGAIVVNIGNQHVLGALVLGSRIQGIFEHHTVLIDDSKLKMLLSRFKDGALTDEEVFEDHGHGCYISSEYSAKNGFNFVAVTGPKREMAKELSFHFASPFGNMMLTGCFGLLKLFSFFDKNMPKYIK